MDKPRKELQQEIEKLRLQIEELEQARFHYQQVELALRESDERYRAFVQTIPDIVYTIDENGIFTFVSDYIEQLGYHPDDLIGKHFSTIIHEEDLGRVSRSSVLEHYHGKSTGDGEAPKLFDERRTRGRKTSGLELRLIAGNEKGPVDVVIDVVTEVSASGFYSKDIKQDDKQFLGTIGVIRDITQRKRQEEALRASREFARNIVDSSMDMIIAVDRNRKIIEFNRAASEAFGYTQDEILGSDVGILYAEPLEGAFIHEEVRERGRIRKEIRSRRKSGEIFPVILSSSILLDARGEFVGVMGVSRDITELKRMEEEILKAQKLESIGMLAGGIAHDFNNILTAILGNISLATYAKSEEELRKRLRETEKAAFRARDLTHQLLTFSGGGAPIKKTASIAELIRETASFAMRGSNVRCDYNIGEGIWSLELDEGQISQVVNNLIINAVQAMPDGGNIHVGAENISLSDDEIPPLPCGYYVRIMIKDHGIGIPHFHLSKIFDPFFSTKQKGSGLGLATSYSIIKNHGGTIIVESELGAGSVFFVYLPASPEQSIGGEEERKDLIHGSGSVLVMDDEEAIREILGEMLAQLGFDADFACEGKEAIEKYRRRKDMGKPYAAVIMDLTIPGGMGGRECIDKLSTFDPEVRAIVSSGYSNDPVMADYCRYGFSGYVTKPYKLEDLSEVLSRILRGVR